MNSFQVNKVDNGFTVTFDQKVVIGEGNSAFNDWETRTFVFETPAKLKKGLKLMVAQLTGETDNV